MKVLITQRQNTVDICQFVDPFPYHVLDAINLVFRAFHTVKGTAGFLGLSIISEIAHHAEIMLSQMRDHEIRCTGGYADLALRSVDMIKELMQALHNALRGEASSVPSGYIALMQILVDPEAAGCSEQVGTVPPPRLGDILVAEGKIAREDVEAAVAHQGRGTDRCRVNARGECGNHRRCRSVAYAKAADRG